MKNLTISAILIITAVISSCASQSGGNTRTNVLRVDYAQVADVRRVSMPSAAPAGAIMGGFAGLILSSGRSSNSQIASGIGGAALGAIATSALEGDRRGYNYNLRFLDGSQASFTTEKGFLRAGDCVSVEQGQYANIRRVPSTMCRGNREVAEVSDEHVRMASQCIEAKNQLLASNSEEAIELARQKVIILCQNFDN